MSQVFLILIDGLRPDAIDAANAPTLRAFRDRSSYTMRAKSLMPTITLPCHMATFYSVPAGRHGITTNTFTPLARPLPSIVDQARTVRKRSAFFTSWDGFSALYKADNLDFQWSYHYVDEGGAYRFFVDDILTDVAMSTLPTIQPDFTFLYYGTTDGAGHVHSWMSRGYLDQVERVDANLARLLPSLPEDAVILIQSDHGGHDQTHGTDMPEDVLIPWMIAGPGIKSGYEIVDTEVSLLNTTPTLAHFMAVPQHGQWEGSVVSEILE